jgi:hypothetical protein
MTTNLTIAVLKVQKVIESCITEAHIEGAKRMVNNFAKQYSTPAGNLFGDQLWTFEPGAAEAYNELWLTVVEKENSIKV